MFIPFFYARYTSEFLRRPKYGNTTTILRVVNSRYKILTSRFYTKSCDLLSLVVVVICLFVLATCTYLLHTTSTYYHYYDDDDDDDDDDVL